MSAIEFRCTCGAEFPEDDMGDTDVCPSCGSDSLFERESEDEHTIVDPSEEMRWMRHEGIDSIPWPKALTVYPVDVKVTL
jgi:DNA-directed RNA polymerase subunit RPC12/RpoP